jgi:hypothetical protein
MQLTLAWLREHGYEAAIAEKWLPHTNIKVDLFGFIDVLAVNEDQLLAIQVTDDSHHAEHVKKILGNTVAPLLAHHMEIELWSWGMKLTGRKRLDGKLDRRKRMTRRVESLTAALIPKSVLARKRLSADLGLTYGE